MNILLHTIKYLYECMWIFCYIFCNVLFPPFDKIFLKYFKQNNLFGEKRGVKGPLAQLGAVWAFTWLLSSAAYT